MGLGALTLQLSISISLRGWSSADPFESVVLVLQGGPGGKSRGLMSTWRDLAQVSNCFHREPNILGVHRPSQGNRGLLPSLDRSQLESVYGQHDARTFATNHALRVLHAPREQRDGNEYSEMLGTFTQQEKSRGRSSSSGAKGGGSSQSTNESSQRRALLLPQEFKELGADREVLILENCKPILADKIRYYTDPVFMGRLMPQPDPPELDLATHLARVEHHVRLAGDDEEFGLDQIAVDCGGVIGDQATACNGCSRYAPATGVGRVRPTNLLNSLPETCRSSWAAIQLTFV